MQKDSRETERRSRISMEKDLLERKKMHPRGENEKEN